MTMFRLSFGLLILILALCVLSPVIAPYSYETQNVDNVLSSPSFRHFFGTDNLGRDVFSRVLYGGQVSLLVAFVTSLFALVFGTLIGTLAAVSGFWAEKVWLRILDIMQSIPTLVLMILLSVIFDSIKIIDDERWRSILGILVALSLVGWVNVARVVRTQVKALKERDFVIAAKSVGAGPWRIFRFHFLPNMAGSLLVLLSYQIPSHILQESFLSFLGLGLQPPYSSWGVLIHEGWRTFQSYPHLIVGPGAVLFVSIFALNNISDKLRDRLNPHLLPGA